MNDGVGPRSYAQNSSYQGGAVEAARLIIEEEIAAKLEIKSPSSSTCPNTFVVADFGCSTGHNSFPAMEIITQAIKRKVNESSSSQTPEFHVYFNDVVKNDFNTLFRALPPHRNYHAAAVAGDFHGRLLPESSVHFGYSSWALMLLSSVPKAVLDIDSSAWNKGEIFSTVDRREVCDAYLDQFGKDMESFLEARAVEVVSGGLMTLIIPGLPETWDPKKEYTFSSDISLMASCLMDMAKMGRFSEAKVNSFNLPLYGPTPRQLNDVLGRSSSFSIERMEILNNPGRQNVTTGLARAAFYRAVHERLLADHFGTEIIDELYDLYAEKFEASPLFLNPDNDKSIVILAILKRTYY